MLDTPQITRTEDQQTAVIRLTVPKTEIQKVMGPGIKELMSTVAAQGIGPAGPWFTHHLRRPTDTFEFEISVPVTAPVAPTGRVTGSRWPAMKVACAVYRGPYEGLAAAWGEFDAWVKASGHKPGADLWEVYVAGPESGSNPAEWRTELNRPIVD
jgi:effector-binding domain-containing protein